MMILAFCLTAIKNHVIKYCGTVFYRNGRNLFWSGRNPSEILNKFQKNLVYLHLIHLLSMLPYLKILSKKK